MTGSSRYSNVAITLHWSIALLIIANLVLGHVMVGAPKASKPVLVPIHVWIGFAVLVLSAVRLGWRLSHPKPASPGAFNPLELRLAALVQWLFYVLMIGLPVVGYLILSANPPNPRMALRILGVVKIPFLTLLQDMDRPSQKSIHDSLVALHAQGGWLMVACFALHIMGVAKHYLFERTNLLLRMMPRFGAVPKDT